MLMDPYSSLLKKDFSLNECNILKEFCEYQQYLSITYFDVYTEYISFKYKGYTIINPFKDITSKYAVDPIVYYGNCFLESNFIPKIKEYKLLSVSSKSKNKKVLKNMKSTMPYLFIVNKI